MYTGTSLHEGIEFMCQNAGLAKGRFDSALHLYFVKPGVVNLVKVSNAPQGPVHD